MSENLTENQNAMSTENSIPALPKTYFIAAILTTIFCCPPIGVFGIIKAARVERLYKNGEYEASKEASDSARKWIIRSILVWAIIIAAYTIIAVFFLKDANRPFI